jgi:hypothetical protein
VDALSELDRLAPAEQDLYVLVAARSACWKLAKWPLLVHQARPDLQGLAALLLVDKTQIQLWLCDYKGGLRAAAAACSPRTQTTPFRPARPRSRRGWSSARGC